MHTDASQTKSADKGNDKMQVNTMRAAVVVQPGTVRVEHVPVPEPGPGQVRVRLEGCGVCASNLPPWDGKPWFTYPFEPGALGHEGWGCIDALGPGVDRFSVGERVAMFSDHAYAEYDITSTDSIVSVPEILSGQPFPGEPLACAMNVFRRSEIKPGQTVAIVGIGFLGALITRLAANAGARVIAISRRPFALNIAQQMGAAEVIPMEDHWQIIDLVRQMTDGKFADIVIEAVGKQWPLDLASELTKERGRLIIAGYHQDGLRQINMQMWNWRGLDVINVHERDPQVYTDGLHFAVDMVASGQLDPSGLYTHTFPLEMLGDALNATRDRPDGFLKALITF